MPNGIGQAYQLFNFLVGLHYSTAILHCHKSGRTLCF